MHFFDLGHVADEDIVVREQEAVRHQVQIEEAKQRKRNPNSLLLRVLLSGAHVQRIWDREEAKQGCREHETEVHRDRVLGTGVGHLVQAWEAFGEQG